MDFETISVIFLSFTVFISVPFYLHRLANKRIDEVKLITNNKINSINTSISDIESSISDINETLSKIRLEIIERISDLSERIAIIETKLNK